MVLYGWKRELDAAALAADPIRELLPLYKAVNAQSKAEEVAITVGQAILILLEIQLLVKLELLKINQMVGLSEWFLI